MSVHFFERDGEDRVKNIMNKLWKISETVCCLAFQNFRGPLLPGFSVYPEGVHFTCREDGRETKEQRM